MKLNRLYLRLILLVVCFCISSYSHSATAHEQIKFHNLQVFFAGIHRFENNHLHPGLPQVVKQDLSLVETLTDRRVPREQIVVLLDDQATSSNCRMQLHELLSRTKPEDVLLFCLHSHGSLGKGGLICTYDTGGTWAFADLIAQIEAEFKGSKACICIAACHSGSIINVIKSKPRRVAYFAITSVHPQVSALTVATSDFQACLRDVFKGAPCPDLNQDALITFEEMGQYISTDQRCLFGTTPDYGWTDNFDPQMIITESEPREGCYQCKLVRLHSGTKGRVIKQDGERCLIRGSKNPNLLESAVCGNFKVLDPGDY